MSNGIEVANVIPKTERAKPTLHILGLAFTVSNRDWPECAYTNKVRRFPRMMMARGYPCIHYGNEGAEVDCEHVTVMSEAERVGFCGERQKERVLTRQKYWDPDFEFKDSENKLWKTFNGHCIAALMPRVKRGDIICHISGCSPTISQAIDNRIVTNVEYGIGYGGSWASFKAFESYHMQSTTWLRQVRTPNPGDPDGQCYDSVIPNYYDVDDFPVGTGDGGYLAFLAHMGIRKGLQIALNIAKHTGLKLIAGGPGLRQKGSKFQADDGQVYDPAGIDFEYVGHCDPQQRAKLLGGALATLVPTRYLEPFGGVNVESQLYGTPALVSDWAGFTDCVEHGRTGFRCRTPDQWVRAVKAVRAGAIDRAYTRQRAIEKFSLESVGIQFHEWFEQIQDRWEAPDPMRADDWALIHQERTGTDWIRS